MEACPADRTKRSRSGHPVLQGEPLRVGYRDQPTAAHRENRQFADPTETADTDGDGCLDSTVDSPALAAAMELSHGLENSLLAKLNNAQVNLDDGDLAGAQEKLLPRRNHRQNEQDSNV